MNYAGLKSKFKYDVEKQYLFSNSAQTFSPAKQILIKLNFRSETWKNLNIAAFKDKINICLPDIPFYYYKIIFVNSTTWSYKFKRLFCTKKNVLGTLNMN